MGYLAGCSITSAFFVFQRGLDIFPMSDEQQPRQQPQRARLYRLEGTRRGGTHVVLLRGMTWDAVKRSHDAVLEAQIFTDLLIIPEL